MIYLDNSATTRPFDEVTALVCDMQRDCFGNPSSLHHAGVLAEHAMEKARKQISAAFGGAEEGRFVFTSGGTEANNLAILGTMLSRIHRKPQIITSKIEHPSVMEAVLYLKELGADCRFAEVNANGQVDVEQFASLLTEETALVSIMSVNNETGCVQNISELVRLSKAKNPKVLFHTDAVQALGKIPITVRESGADLVSVSGHKINGPKGSGGLFIRRGVHVKPVCFGGGQEGGLRSGTQNTPAIAGFGLAAELTLSAMAEQTSKMDGLRRRLAEELGKIPGCRVIETAQPAPHIVCALFPGVKAETFLHMLEAKEIYVSGGSACSSNKPQLSPTLLAMGCSRKETEGAIRFSLCTGTTEAEVLAAAAAAREAAAVLMSM